MIARSDGSARFDVGRMLLMGAAFVGWTFAQVPVILAQGVPPDNRVALDLTVGYQTNLTRVSQTIAFEQYSEEGSLTSTSMFGRRPSADAGLVLRLWRTFGVAVSGSYFRDSESADVNVLVPNPFVFGQPRQVTGKAALSHTELAMHYQATYWTKLSPRLDVMVSGGPSVFRIHQDFVSDVTYADTFPYDTATYQGASVISQRKTVTGGNVGSEVGWRVATHLAIDAAARFSRGTADFAGTSAQPVVVGGLRVGGGLRLVF